MQTESDQKAFCVIALHAYIIRDSVFKLGFLVLEVRVRIENGEGCSMIQK